VIERQNHLREQKKEEREEFGNHEHKRKTNPSTEFNAFARTGQGKPKYTIQQLRDMPKNTSAKSLGISECRICKRNGKCPDHIFVHCIDELKKAKTEKKDEQRNLSTNNNESANSIMAKVELAYRLGQAEGLKNAQEANKFLAAASDTT
jgi:hypothetical protein